MPRRVKPEVLVLYNIKKGRFCYAICLTLRVIIRKLVQDCTCLLFTKCYQNCILFFDVDLLFVCLSIPGGYYMALLYCTVLYCVICFSFTSTTVRVDLPTTNDGCASRIGYIQVVVVVTYFRFQWYYQQK